MGWASRHVAKAQSNRSASQLRARDAKQKQRVRDPFQANVRETRVAAMTVRSEMIPFFQCMPPWFRNQYARLLKDQKEKERRPHAEFMMLSFMWDGQHRVSSRRRYTS